MPPFVPQPLVKGAKRDFGIAQAMNCSYYPFGGKRYRSPSINESAPWASNSQFLARVIHAYPQEHLTSGRLFHICFLFDHGTFLEGRCGRADKAKHSGVGGSTAKPRRDGRRARQ